jgi:tungstate transport system substrate-binding protein
MTPKEVTGLLAAVSLLLTAAAGCGGGQVEGGGGSMILATTTSTKDTGLLDAILPSFQQGSGCVPKTVAVGSGQAMAMGERGDADVLLVHSPEAEQRFMTDGHGTSRQPVMYNDFVLVGPPDDPAKTGGAADAASALRLIAEKEAPFASRADDSGTHAKEMSLWKKAGVAPAGDWYIRTGQGMGQTLTIANQKRAYTLADRGTFLAGADLESKIAFEKSPDLRNPYHVIVVKGAANAGCATKFAEWIRSGQVQRTIGGFGVQKYGQPLFFPDASPGASTGTSPGTSPGASPGAAGS